MQNKRSIDRTQIIVAVIAVVGVIITAYWQFVWKPSYSSTQQITHVGRVIDSKTDAAIRGVKVSLDFHGTPPIVHTDSEGIYRFTVNFAGNDLPGRVRAEATGYQIYERLIKLTPGKSSLEDIRLIPIIPTSSDSKPLSIKQLSSQTTPTKIGVNECDSIPLELMGEKLVRLKLVNGRIFTGIIQLQNPFDNYISKGLIPLLSYGNLEKLRGRFGTDKYFGIPEHEVNEFIDWINNTHIHSCEIVETTLNTFQVITRSGKKIDMANLDRFGLEVSIGSVPGSVKIKFKLPDLEKSFNLGEFEIRNGIVSLPVTTVFISYTPEDRKAAVSLASDLQNRGILPWFDENITLPGDNPQSKMAQVIEQVDYFLPILSCQYNNRELHLAMYQQSSLPENKRFIIPILLDDCDIPTNLRKLNPLKMTDKDWLKKLLKSMAPIPHTDS